MALDRFNQDLLDEDETVFSLIAEAIRLQGYVVLVDSIPANVSRALTTHLQAMTELEFSSARVGRGQEQVQNSRVRSDQIAWIEADTPLSQEWINWSVALQRYLNQRLFLGLFSFESHFACYKPGDYYQTHVDSFRGGGNRILSLVTYLNPDWQLEDGGELVIYDPSSGSELTRVVPRLGTLVLFLSEEFPHEVKPAKRQRYSVAGWFRVNTSTQDRVDPPQ